MKGLGDFTKVPCLCGSPCVTSTGLTASLLREGSYSTIRMGGYENIKSLLVNSSAERDNLPLSKKIIAGAVSGALGAGIANPTDLVIHSFFIFLSP